MFCYVHTPLGQFETFSSIRHFERKHVNVPHQEATSNRALLPILLFQARLDSLHGTKLFKSHKRPYIPICVSFGHQYKVLLTFCIFPQICTKEQSHLDCIASYCSKQGHSFVSKNQSSIKGSHPLLSLQYLFQEGGYDMQLYFNKSFSPVTSVIILIQILTYTTIMRRVSSLQLHIHWFRNTDLRLHDNPALNRAAASAFSQKGPDGDNAIFLPIYCFDPRFIGGGESSRSRFGSRKCSSQRARFMIESVEDLRRSLKGHGSELVCAQGKPEDVLERVIQCIDESYEGKDLVVTVHCQEEVASEELSVDKAVRRVLKKHPGSSLKPVWGSTLYLPQDLPFGAMAGKSKETLPSYMSMPDVFTPFRNKVEKNSDIRNPFDVPKSERLSLLPNPNAIHNIAATVEKCSVSFLPSLTDLEYTQEEAENALTTDTRGVMHFVGGETAALARVKDYIWDKDLLKNYFNTRNGMIGADYSTKFSPWLANGCISPRYIATECRNYEEERVANKSTYWVVFELLWRDFFKFFAAKHGDRIFYRSGTSEQHNKKWGYNRKSFDAWKEGRTGYPLVDANMRELAATGFMSNRGRQNVCSFLAIDMKTDWTYGADYFESTLLDHDVHSNWGNWCSGAGMTGGRLNRFNIVKQSKDYDCDGDYVRLWIPEMKDLPNELIHEPWKMTAEQESQFGVRLGVDYPKPIVKPFVPRANNDQGRNGGRRNNKGWKGKGGDEKKKNSNLGKGQRKEMKSLKEGNYRVVGEWTL